MGQSKLLAILYIGKNATINKTWQDRGSNFEDQTEQFRL